MVKFAQSTSVMRKILLFILLIHFYSTSNAQVTVTFPSKDGLLITGDWYPVSNDSPVMLLCHQDGYSRGEYAESALRLNKLGFNCLAIDQRVGHEVNGIKNETAALAEKNKLHPTYLDAEQDIVASIDFLYQKYGKNVILLGSSYSASLALKIASTNNKVDALIVFSPGEYADDKNYFKSTIGSLMKPVLITSSREEADAVTDLLKDVNSRIKVQYIPADAGYHGSKALWSTNKGNQDYWAIVISFLNKIKAIQ